MGLQLNNNSIKNYQKSTQPRKVECLNCLGVGSTPQTANQLFVDSCNNA